MPGTRLLPPSRHPPDPWPEPPDDTQTKAAPGHQPLYEHSAWLWTSWAGHWLSLRLHRTSGSIPCAPNFVRAVTEYVDHHINVRSNGDPNVARAFRAVTIGSTAQALTADTFRMLQARGWLPQPQQGLRCKSVASQPGDQCLT
jgi:hypothetical protein